MELLIVVAAVIILIAIMALKRFIQYRFFYGKPYVPQVNRLGNAYGRVNIDYQPIDLEAFEMGLEGASGIVPSGVSYLPEDQPKRLGRNRKGR